MADLNAKKFTLNIAKDVQTVLRTMRKSLVENSDIIEFVDTDQLFYVHDISQKNFTFYIGAPTRDEQEKQTEFPITFTPESADSLSHTNRYVWTDDVEDQFDEWISLIREFNEITFTEEETFAKFYEDEIFVDFEIIDEDSTTHPFNNFQQVLLYKFLSATIFYLENKHPDDNEIKDICIDALDLRDNIQNLTKKDFSKRFSKVLAKIKKFSLQTFIEISDVAKKEIYKYMLHEGVKGLPHWIDNIHTFFIAHI